MLSVTYRPARWTCGHSQTFPLPARQPQQSPWQRWPRLQPLQPRVRVRRPPLHPGPRERAAPTQDQPAPRRGRLPAAQVCQPPGLPRP